MKMRKIRFLHLFAIALAVLSIFVFWFRLCIPTPIVDERLLEACRSFHNASSLDGRKAVAKEIVALESSFISKHPFLRHRIQDFDDLLGPPRFKGDSTGSYILSYDGAYFEALVFDNYRREWSVDKVEIGMGVF